MFICPEREQRRLLEELVENRIKEIRSGIRRPHSEKHERQLREQLSELENVLWEAEYKVTP